MIVTISRYSTSSASSQGRPVTWNHPRAAVREPWHGNRRHRQLDEAVQGVDLALNAAALVDVDHREAL
jgi:hypothetical protein